MLDTTSSLEPRLQKRYKQLVKEHLNASQTIAAGLRALPRGTTAFASVQAAWRFYANEDVTLEALVEPLIFSAREAVLEESLAYALCLHDWTDLNYANHTRKENRIEIGSKKTLGFQLQTALVISDRDGTPIAPVFESLWAEDGIHTTRSRKVEEDAPQIDEITESINHISQLGFSKPVVHIIDRGADSVAHYRAWDKSGHLFLVRADDKQRVLHQGRDILLSEVVDELDFKASRPVDVNGVGGMQFVAETEVQIVRPARPHRQRKGVVERRKVIKGEPISLRLVVTQIRSADETLLSQWFLYTNVKQESAATIALWYYWRWKIESFFKLLKSAGHNLEQWQQEKPEAIAKRLLVAAMACVIVWQLARATSPEAKEARKLLVRLSGRQMRWGKAFTEPALLAGMWVLLAMLEALEQYKVSELKGMARTILQGFGRPDRR
ncbi:MAG: transposase [Thermodesulfobacteriota bacterium]